MFRITKDHLAEDPPVKDPSGATVSRVGTVGVEGGVNSVMRLMGIPPHPLPERDATGMPLDLIPFKLYDDDKILYYEGVLHDDDNCENQSAALLYGELDAGCTTIEVGRELHGEMQWIVEIG